MAATLVGGAFLGAAFNVLLDRLASNEFIDFFRGRKLDEGLLQKLKLTLLELKKVLNDAEEKQITDEAVQRWVDELKCAVYDAEDLMDEFRYEALRSKVEAEHPRDIQERLRDSLTSTSTWVSGRGGMNSKLEKMLGRLAHFVTAIDVLGLREVAGLNWTKTSMPTTSLVDESCIYGRETEKEEIMKLLLSDGGSSRGIDVIPIIGMGGVGKTTLARLLYNDSKVVAHFDTKAWICVSDVFDVFAISRTMFEAVGGDASKIKDLNLLHLKLKEILDGKKFLRVLDDVWNENPDSWDALMSPFKSGAPLSKIIVTARNDGVASTMGTIPIYRLHVLPEEDCWKLFCQRAFENGDHNTHPSLQTIGREIVRKCKGLPLAAKTLGSLLRSQRDVEDWNKILESDIWELPKEKSNILPALRLSYLYLPSHLKRCFSYCSILTKDYEFNMQELVSIWIAEDFLEPRTNTTLEEEGCECFRELLSRSFFQRSKADDSLYVMHDLVHDLAQYVMGDFCHRLEVSLEERLPHSEKVRHVSFDANKVRLFKKFEGLRDTKYLRTFRPFPNVVDHGIGISPKVLDEILLRLTHLRMLSLQRTPIGKLPHSVGGLIHLRFLDFTRSYISELPGSICSLYNLQTLLLLGCGLKKIPANMAKLISLRHLDLEGNHMKEMPKNISMLKNLQQLTVFIVGKLTGTKIKELGKFHRLRGKISIVALENVMSGHDALEAKMSEKGRLEGLALEWSHTTQDSQVASDDVLEKLEPHTNLKRLTIQNYGGSRFPTWLGVQKLRNMVSLRLSNCKNCCSLPPLGQIPSLKEVTIEGMPGIKSVGHEFYGESGFGSKPFQFLERLCFGEMSEWVDWCTFDAVEFSGLQTLKVTNCPKLIGHLPTKMPSLVELEIRNCAKLVDSFLNSTSMRNLYLGKCHGMQFRPQGVSSVEKLEIAGCASLNPSSGEQAIMRNNQKRPTAGNSSLCFPLPEEISHCGMFLEKLTLTFCENLKSLPLGLFPKLRSLEITNCRNFETLLIPGGIGPQHPILLLEKLSIDGGNMSSFPSGGLPAPNLSNLILRHCKQLKALPELMNRLLPSLQNLYIIACPEIESFPEGGLPSKLGLLWIFNCKKLVVGRRDWGLQTLSSLTTFGMRSESEDVLESFPEEGLLPSTVTYISISGQSNLESLNERGLRPLSSLKSMEIQGCSQLRSLSVERLPPSLLSLRIVGCSQLQSLSVERLPPSLSSLRISHCPQLQSLSVERLPPSLLSLDIQRCPLLQYSCRREKGQEWHKIAHIPEIDIGPPPSLCSPVRLKSWLHPCSGLGKDLPL